MILLLISMILVSVLTLELLIGTIIWMFAFVHFGAFAGPFSCVTLTVVFGGSFCCVLDAEKERKEDKNTNKVTLLYMIPPLVFC